MIMAVILAGLLVGSALFIIRDVEPKWHQIPVFTIYGLLASGILGFRMLRDIRKGDHDDWPGWNHD